MNPSSNQPNPLPEQKPGTAVPQTDDQKKAAAAEALAKSKA
jgi:hypothetical protein